MTYSDRPNMCSIIPLSVSHQRRPIILLRQILLKTISKKICDQLSMEILTRESFGQIHLIFRWSRVNVNRWVISDQMYQCMKLWTHNSLLHHQHQETTKLLTIYYKYKVISTTKFTNRIPSTLAAVKLHLISSFLLICKYYEYVTLCIW